ncbi:MAG: ATP-binding protein [Verrucomicrobiae bacterium]|nr:ATP-binding protein [Verrucomicrobiae bacterium]
MTSIPRLHLKRHVEESLEDFRITALLGPRQCGKTTLAREFPVPRENYFDLEDPLDLARLRNPREVLGSLTGLVVIDEIQRLPGLYPILRVLADRPGRPASFLILGSAAPDLTREAAETLAGRVHFVQMSGFHAREVGADVRDRLWLRGGFPESYLAESDEVSGRWRRSFVETFLLRDLPSFGIGVAPERMRRFWTMVAHYHGQTWNGSAIGASMDVSPTTARTYLDLLTDTFVIRQLPPWLPNLKKRMVKAPKIYVRDSGLLHSLLHLETMMSLQSSPRFGASWEGFAMAQLLEALDEQPGEAHFWSTHAGAEMDLVLSRKGHLYGFEFKATESPRITKSMRIARDDLGLKGVFLVYPGTLSFPLGEGFEALGYAQIPNFGLG